jgi:hypothetical protein
MPSTRAARSSIHEMQTISTNDGALCPTRFGFRILSERTDPGKRICMYISLSENESNNAKSKRC